MQSSALRYKPLGKGNLIGGNSRNNPIEVSSHRIFDLSGDLEPFKEACRDPRGLSNAFGMLEAIAKNKNSCESGAAKAVYVISVDGEPSISKIGVSANAVFRLGWLQSQHYRKLFLHAVIFCPRHNAVKVEQAILRNAVAAEKRLEGEWVEYPSDDVLTQIMEYARDSETPIVDGRTWFEDVSRRTLELARKSRMRRAA